MKKQMSSKGSVTQGANTNCHDLNLFTLSLEIMPVEYELVFIFLFWCTKSMALNKVAE